MFFKKKQKRFLVRLTKRGNQFPLGIIEAKDEKELLGKLSDLIIERVGEENAKQFTTIRITNLETLQEVKLPNPFSTELAESTIETSEKSKDSSDKLITGDILVDQFINFLRFNNEIIKVMLTESTKAITQAYAEAIKTVMSLPYQPQESTANTFESMIKFVDSLRWIIENKDKINQVLSSQFSQSTQVGESK